MTVLFNSWFPEGGQFADWTQYDGMGNVGESPVAAEADHLALVTDPTGQAGTVAQITALLTDPDTFGTRYEILPFSPPNGDPITDWGGADADSRRWYRFAFMVRDWQREVDFSGTPQFTVVWQVHDDEDTSPADTVVTPPLWLKDNGRGYWELWNTYCADSQTTASNYTYRLLTRFPIVNDKWEELVVFVKWSWTAGELSVWRDRRKIFQDVSGTPNCFNNLAARGGGKNYPKLGVYQKTSDFDRTVFHQGMQVGDEAYATFDAFLAACGSSDTELERVTPMRCAFG